MVVDEQSRDGPAADTPLSGPPDAASPSPDAPATLAHARVLQDGRLDPGLVLGTWLLRRLAWVTLWAGVIVAILAGREAALLDEALFTFDSVRTNLLSPLAGVILAVGMRIASSLGATAVAYPLAREFERSRVGDRGRRRSNPGVWMDRYRAALGLRQLRWTSGVRRLARDRFGPLGPVIQRIDIGLLVAGIVLIPVTFVVLVLTLAA